MACLGRQEAVALDARLYGNAKQCKKKITSRQKKPPELRFHGEARGMCFCIVPHFQRFRNKKNAASPKKLAALPKVANLAAVEPLVTAQI
jgi:hypothetical protein